MSLISVPLFKSNNTEKLEAVDAYNVTDSRPVNKVYDAAKNTAGKLYDRVGGARGLSNAITQLTIMKTSGATGRQMLESGLGMFNTSTMGILRSVGGGVLDKAGEFIDIDPSVVSKIKTTGEGLYRRLEHGDAKDLSNYGDLLGLMGDLSGNPEWAEYVNIGYESAVWGAALAQATEYGQYDYYSNVKQFIDPEVYRQAVIYSIPAVATSGSLEAVKELITALDVDTVMANKPDFIPAFLKQFRLPDERPTDMQAYGAEVVTVLTSLDSRWYRYDRDGSDIFDIKYLAGASDAAILLLDGHAEVGPLIQIARHFPEVTVEDVAREQFPMMVSNLG